MTAAVTQTMARHAIDEIDELITKERAVDVSIQTLFETLVDKCYFIEVKEILSSPEMGVDERWMVLTSVLAAARRMDDIRHLWK
ncbi:hypothetical protein MMC07_005234 [Pseudocyphellaria aurata]|nr:hypothetical protein [Pseudocyphellaria aurata]